MRKMRSKLSGGKGMKKKGTNAERVCGYERERERPCGRRGTLREQGRPTKRRDHEQLTTREIEVGIPSDLPLPLRLQPLA